MFRKPCYDAERRENRRDFEDGMDELFRIMFDSHVFLYLMDEKATQKNVYDEARVKIYKQPYQLTAKVTIGREHGEEVEQTTIQTATITAPNLQFKKLGIPHRTEEDLETLKKAIIKYKEFVFLVDEVKPTPHITGTYLFYEFHCTTRNKDNSKYILPPFERE